MPDLNFVRSEIERMRTQVLRQRRDIRQLQEAGISTASAELLLTRMLTKIRDLCTQRDELRRLEPGHTKGVVIGGRRW